MPLRLRIISDSEELPADQRVREFANVGGTIGRHPHNDWVMPDKRRYVSGRHAVVEYQAGAWYLLDTSLNGVFVNGSDMRIGRGRRQRLFDLDRLRIGEFEIAVEISDRGEDIPENKSVDILFASEDKFVRGAPLHSHLAPAKAPAQVAVGRTPSPATMATAPPAAPEFEPDTEQRELVPLLAPTGLKSEVIAGATPHEGIQVAIHSQGQQDEVGSSVGKSLASNPDSVPTRLRLAETHAQNGQETEALDILADLIRDRPELMVPQLMHGMLCIRLGRLEDAKTSLQTASQLAPDRPFPTYMLGNVHYKLGELNAAERCYRAIIELSGRFLPAEYALADVLIASQRYTEAIALLNSVLARSPHKNACHQRLGVIYTHQGRYARALEEFRVALKHDPEVLAIDPAIEELLNNSQDEATLAKAFMERFRTIQIESVNRLKATPFRDRVRAHQGQRKVRRLTNIVT